MAARKHEEPLPIVVERASWDYIKKALADPTIQVGLAGPPGVGKTYGAMLCRTQSPNKKLPKVTHKTQSHSEVSPAEWLGMYVPVENGFQWMPGPIDLCYTQGGLLVIDEIIEASGPMKTFLYGALDRGPGGTISYAGRTFVQQPGYQVVATMNGWPDQGGLSPALLDRFDAWFIVTQPSEEQLQLLEPDLRDICRDYYSAEVVEDEMAGPETTFRMLVGLQKLRKIMPLEMAVLSACNGNKGLAQSLFEVIQLTDPIEEVTPPRKARTHARGTSTPRTTTRQATLNDAGALEEDEIPGLNDNIDDIDDDESWDDE